MKIVTLIENTSLEPSLAEEHGLSLYIEFEDKKILFDTGSSNKFIDNAQKLNINLEDIDYTIISHGHYDHCGGLVNFLRLNKKTKVFIKRQALDKHYSTKDKLTRYIGAPIEILDNFKDRLTYIDSFQSVFDNAYIIPLINIENTDCIKSKNFFTLKGDNLVSDTFNHELIFVLKEEDGLVVFTGCSHNGVTNMIDTVSMQFNNLKIKALIGGFHLVRFPAKTLNCSVENIIELGKNLKNSNVDTFFTCHCTGLEAFVILKEQLQESISYLSTGSEINI